MIDRSGRGKNRYPQWPFKVAYLIGTDVAETILASAQLRARQKGRTYGSKRSDQNIATKPCEEGVDHIWGSALTHHPHVHMIVPGGGIAPDGMRWVASRAAFLLPVRVLGKLFRRLFLTRLTELHQAGKLAFFGALAGLVDRRRFLRHLVPVRNKRWVVYAKPPFAGPEAVLAYLARYTHRVAISNRRLIAFDQAGVTFRYKDYRRSGRERQQVMTLDAHEFMRRFLLHVLPRGFHRIRHYGLLASATRKANISRARELLAVPPPSEPAEPMEAPAPTPPCPCCGGRMRIIESFGRWRQPRAPPKVHMPTGMTPS